MGGSFSIQRDFDEINCNICNVLIFGVIYNVDSTWNTPTPSPQAKAGAPLTQGNPKRKVSSGLDQGLEVVIDRNYNK